MNNKLKYIILSALLASSLAIGQTLKEKKAEDNFESYAYAKAIDSYEDLVKDGYTSEQIYKNLGNANYNNANYAEASEWYRKLHQLEDATIEPDYLYRYSQTLKSLERYSESDHWMKKFKAATSNDIRVSKFEKNKNYLEKIKEQSGRYIIQNEVLNSKGSDFAPSYYGEELVFSTARDSGIIAKSVHAWNRKSFLNLYKTKISEEGTSSNSKKLSRSLNKKTHESSTAFTKDGQTLYFTRNNSKRGKFSRDIKGISRLKIYKATLENGDWVNITELPFNSDDYSVAHPTLSADDKKLYFSSDMPGTYGLSDIFVVDIHEDGTYGEPKNLGNKINTEARETFPFITPSNVLYFASDGHPGLGGLDIFAATLQDSYVVNIGAPVNTKQDDFSFIINEEKKEGYFASNRKGGVGSDDIYSFKQTTPLEIDCNLQVSGVVKDEKTGALLPNTKLRIVNSKGNVLKEIESDNRGSFSFEEKCLDGEYAIEATRAYYEPGNKLFAIANSEDVTGVEVLLGMEKRVAPLGTDLTTYLNLEPIYFDLDKSFIRADARRTLEKVLGYMKANPSVKIDVRSHTDSRSSKAYNDSLSMRRAKATVAYLVSKGIDPSRLSGNGYGERELTNECADLVPCSEGRHQMNRRSEFIVVK